MRRKSLPKAVVRSALSRDDISHRLGNVLVRKSTLDDRIREDRVRRSNASGYGEGFEECQAFDEGKDEKGRDEPGDEHDGEEEHRERLPLALEVCGGEVDSGEEDLCQASTVSS